ncbi:MAG TPA: fumarylacetoacetate hydrolase family protein [Steroidobacteraceae bacterium]|nr:fumarylacetoacetate hydrolase family protein [Steroidobacteraceae bacterium]
MKLLRHGPHGAEKPGLLDAQGRARDLSMLIEDIDAALLSTQFAALAAVKPETLPLVAGDVRLGVPVARVGKIVCIGLNYRDHAAEAQQPPPQEPIIFLKAVSALNGPEDPVVLPPDSHKADWEVELGVVIGSECRYVSERQALEYVAGVCVVDDLSEREFQIERGGQWDKGKGCDTFGPVGPYLVTGLDAGQLGRLGLWLEVNGKRMQEGNTANMIFPVPFLVHYISQFMSLQPGDVIATGTPAGVGMGRKPPVWLQEGDTIRAGIDGLGEQRQCVRRFRRQG